MKGKHSKVAAVVAGIWLVLSAQGGSAVELKKINELLPEGVKEYLDISLQFRHRFEYRYNFDFNSANDDQDGFHLIRTRLNVKITPFKYASAFVQIQDSRIYEDRFVNETPFRDDFDVRQAYLDIKPLGSDLLILRVGRQEMRYGKERILGGFNWSNVAQSFDAVRLMVNTEFLKAHAFAARKVQTYPKRVDDWDAKDNLLGLYLITRKVPKHQLEIYYFFRDTTKAIAFGPSGADQLDEHTVGGRIQSDKIYGFEYEIEGAYQFGNFGARDISAFALVVLGAYTVPVKTSPRLMVEWDLASGDKDPGDLTRGTFDNLWPTNHLHYGYMDRASLQNLNNLRFQLSMKPFKKLYLQVDAHYMRVYTTYDALYAANRKPLRNPPSDPSSTSSYVGVDLDFLLKYKINRFVSILAGYTHFFAGDFLKATGAGDDGQFFYVQTTISL